MSIQDAKDGNDYLEKFGISRKESVIKWLDQHGVDYEKIDSLVIGKSKHIIVYLKNDFLHIAFASNNEISIPSHIIFRSKDWQKEED